MDNLEAKKSFSVFCFGSRAKNTFKQYSDLDLWIEAKPNLSVREISLLHEKFNESNIAIQIDVVTPETCLPEYKNSILTERVLWFSSK